MFFSGEGEDDEESELLNFQLKWFFGDYYADSMQMWVHNGAEIRI